MKIFLGVDFGESGGLAAIDETGKIIEAVKMPIKHGKIDCFTIYSWLHQNFDEVDQEVICYGEKLRAIFRASASSTFNFGKNIGLVTGIIESFEMEFVEVEPKTWQNYMFTILEIPPTHLTKKTPSGKLKTDTKHMAAQAVKKRWGIESKHDGIIDALLIAEYARLQHKLTESLNGN